MYLYTSRLASCIQLDTTGYIAVYGNNISAYNFFVLLVNDLLTKDNETLTKVNEKLTKVKEKLTKVNESFIKEYGLNIEKWPNN